MPIIHCAIPGYEGTYDINSRYLAEFLEASNMPDTILHAQPWTIVTPDEYTTFQHTTCPTALNGNTLYDGSPDTFPVFSHAECTICWLSDIPPDALTQKRQIRRYPHREYNPRMINMANHRGTGNPIFHTHHPGGNAIDLLRMMQGLLRPDDE